jgi:hypothetical protein
MAVMCVKCGVFQPMHRLVTAYPHRRGYECRSDYLCIARRITAQQPMPLSGLEDVVIGSGPTD